MAANGRASQSATVEVLTAEVRTLHVGSRQVTLSVYRQLDWVPADEIEPWGRVQDKPPPGVIEVVGSHNGTLARAKAASIWCNCGGPCPGPWSSKTITATCTEQKRLMEAYAEARQASDALDNCRVQPRPYGAYPPPPQQYPPPGAPPVLPSGGFAPPGGGGLPYDEWLRQRQAAQERLNGAWDQLGSHPVHGWYVYQPAQELWEAWEQLPLIVLAGLR
jgi:hypothetical protein